VILAVEAVVATMRGKGEVEAGLFQNHVRLVMSGEGTISYTRGWGKTIILRDIAEMVLLLAKSSHQSDMVRDRRIEESLDSKRETDSSTFKISETAINKGQTQEINVMGSLRKVSDFKFLLKFA
jgi:hypothetical protein